MVLSMFRQILIFFPARASDTVADRDLRVAVPLLEYIAETIGKYT
jgi:hypothetical protein